jgi:hypothetical protein
MFVFGLHHLNVQCVQALYLLAQRCNLLIEPGEAGITRSRRYFRL